MPPGRSTSSPDGGSSGCIGPALLRRWLVEASRAAGMARRGAYAAVGDLAETIALLLDEPGARRRRPTPRSPTGSSSACCRCAASTSRAQREQVLGLVARLPTASASC
jgi:hypothetical protein